MQRFIYKTIWGGLFFLLISCVNNLPAASVVQTAVADQNYLRQCKTINPGKTMEQATYMGITPGTTGETELESILGAPDQKLSSVTTINWIYDDTTVFVDHGVVEEVIVNYMFSPREDASEYQLDQIVLDIGCPNIIFAVNMSEDMAGYTNTRFIYPQIGLELTYRGFPVEPPGVINFVDYFQPTSVQEYLEQFTDAYFVPFSKKLIDWGEAVR